MSEELNKTTKTIRDYPVHKFSPFTVKSQYLAEDNTFAASFVQKDEKDVSLRKLTGLHIIDQKDAIDLVGNVLKDKLGLTKGGVNIFKYLFEKYKENIKNSNNDHMTLKVDFEDCRDVCGYASTQSVWYSLIELLSKDIIARSGVPAVYYINPVFFNPASTIALTEYYKIQA